MLTPVSPLRLLAANMLRGNGSISPPPRALFAIRHTLATIDVAADTVFALSPLCCATIMSRLRALPPLRLLMPAFAALFFAAAPLRQED